MQVTMKDPKTGQMYGGLVKDGVPQFKAPDGSTPAKFRYCWRSCDKENSS